MMTDAVSGAQKLTLTFCRGHVLAARFEEDCKTSITP